MIHEPSSLRVVRVSSARAELGVTLRPCRKALAQAVAWFEQEHQTTRHVEGVMVKD